MTTAFLALAFGGMMAVAWALWALFFWLGARWAKIPNVTFPRALLAGAGVTVASAAFRLLPMLWFASTNTYSSTLMLSVDFGSGFVVSMLVLRMLFRATMGRLVLAWLPTVGAGLIIMTLMVFVFKPFLFESYFVPTNGMAPTLLGPRRIGKCPRCGADTYGSFFADWTAGDPVPDEPVNMICSRDLKACPMDNPRIFSLTADRFFVAKFMAPRRWDLAVFKYPADPKNLYVQRLVGLPGETVMIRDGAVWINGIKQSPPPEIAALEYADQIPTTKGDVPIRWANAANPVKLGPDEFFMLGDFSVNSSDSRMWWSGAPGHPAYAVPRANLVGVATHIYWPPARMRTLR